MNIKTPIERKRKDFVGTATVRQSTQGEFDLTKSMNLKNEGKYNTDIPK